MSAEFLTAAVLFPTEGPDWGAAEDAIATLDLATIVAGDEWWSGLEEDFPDPDRHRTAWDAFEWFTQTRAHLRHQLEALRQALEDHTNDLTALRVEAGWLVIAGGVVGFEETPTFDALTDLRETGILQAAGAAVDDMWGPPLSERVLTLTAEEQALIAAADALWAAMDVALAVDAPPDRHHGPSARGSRDELLSIGREAVGGKWRAILDVLDETGRGDALTQALTARLRESVADHRGGPKRHGVSSVRPTAELQPRAANLFACVPLPPERINWGAAQRAADPLGAEVREALSRFRAAIEQEPPYATIAEVSGIRALCVSVTWSDAWDPREDLRRLIAAGLI